MQLLSQEGPNQILCFPADPQVTQEHWLLQAQQHFQEQGHSLSHPRGPRLNDHFKQPLKKVFPSSCLPREQLRSLSLSAALFLRCLSETPTEEGCLPGSEGAASWALACPLVGLGLESSLRRVLILGEFWEWRQKVERREQTLCVKVPPPLSLGVTRGDWARESRKPGCVGHSHAQWDEGKPL